MYCNQEANIMSSVVADKSSNQPRNRDGHQAIKAPQTLVLKVVPFHIVNNIFQNGFRLFKSGKSKANIFGLMIILLIIIKLSCLQFSLKY